MNHGAGGLGVVLGVGLMARDILRIGPERETNA